MKTWVCNVCGYTHQGEEPPERCPKCGATKSQFTLKNKSGGSIFGILIIVMILAVVFSLFTC